MRVDAKQILSPEELDILYSPKQDWFDVNGGKQDWDKSHNNITLFWRAVRKIISYDVRHSAYINLDDISFPQFEEVRILEGHYLKDDNFFFKNEENIFECDVSFINSTFYGNAYFSNIIFKEKAIFDNANFKNEVSFNKSEFCEEASFKNATFSGNSYFQFSKFYKISDFNRTTFEKKASFRNSIFYSSASFRKMVCNQNLYFWASDFKSKVDFWNTRCEGKAEFTSAKFAQEAFFWDIDFSGVTTYNNATFSEKANFRNSRFKDVSFTLSVFKKEANFSYTIFTNGSFIDSSFYSLNFYQSRFTNATLNNLNGFKIMKSVPLSASNIANKETARIIKNFSIKKNNINDINKFYAIELEKIEDDLQNYNIKDWLVLKAYKYISCYSQNYILPLIWLIAIASIFTAFYPDEISIEIFMHLINPFELVVEYNLHKDYYTEALASRTISLFFIYHFIISIKQKVVKR